MADMFGRLTFLLCLTVYSGASLFAQTSSVSGVASQTIPDQVLYRFFFDHVDMANAFSNHIEATGKSDRTIRDYFKNGAQLTDSEDQALKGIAVDCHDAVAAIDKQASAVYAQALSQIQTSPSHSVSAPLLQQMTDFRKAKDQTILDHIQQLKSAFGTQRFQHLDTFVRASEIPHIGISK